MHLRRVFPVLFVLSMVAFGCGKSYFYNHEIELPNKIWTYNNVLKYEFNISDTNQIYNLYIDVRHDEEYNFQNIYYKIYTVFPSGKKMGQTLSLDLFDKAGRPNGKGRSVTGTLREGLYFNEPGKYAIELEQFMRKDSIKGIEKIGIKLEQTEHKRK